MKKKILLCLLILLTALCLGALSACFMFPDFDEGDSPAPPIQSEGTGLKAPESVRLDMPDKMLYVPDCSASGVTYYEVIQRYDDLKKITKATVGSLNTVNMQTEEGYFKINVRELVARDEFDLTVFCTKQAGDKEGVTSEKFTFKNAGGILYDEEHCTFNAETGLFTWSKVDDATGYRIDIGYTFITIVEEPQFVADESVASFKVTPLFDVYKFGTSETIYLDSFKPSIQYNAYSRAFTWSQSGSRYAIEITENGNTTRTELTEETLPFVPSSDRVRVKLSVLDPLRRPASVEVTYDVLPLLSDIALGVFSRELSWGEMDGVSGYDIVLEYGDGSRELKETSEPKLKITTTQTGAITAKIRPRTSTMQTPSIALYADFAFYLFGAVSGVNATLLRDPASGKISVSLTPEKSIAEGYTISMTADGAEDQTVEIDCDEVDTVYAEFDLPMNQIRQVVVSRKYRGGEGHYCFKDLTSLPADYSRQVLYVGAPEVIMTNKNAELSSRRAFTVQVKFPEACQGKGYFTLKRNYATYSTYTTSLFGDSEFTLPVVSGTAHLEFTFSSFIVSGSTISLYSDKYETDVTCLNSVSISADSEKISWQGVDGADSYRVEKSESGEYAAVYSGAQTQYLHGVNSVGEHLYRVVAMSSAPFVLDSDADACTITKLEKPTIAMSEAGEIEITSLNDAVSIVTLLDGAIAPLTEDSLRAALTNKSTAELVARCTRAGTQKAVYIDSDDTATYTLHRIADLIDNSVALAIDAATKKVTCTTPNGAYEYICRLLYRSSADEAYALMKQFSDNVIQIDGTELNAGQYALAVKPISTREGEDFYLYLGDFATGTFQKDGIRSIHPLADGTGFAIDSFVYRADDYNVRWRITYRLSATPQTFFFEMGDSVNITENEEAMNLLTSLGTNLSQNLVFAVDYGATEEELLRSKTLKADDRTIAFSVKRSFASSDFKGAYAYVDRQNNVAAPAQVKVTLTPADGEVLKSFESYTVIHRRKACGAATSSASLVSETDGTELIFNVGDERFTHLLRLGIKSDRFAEEDGNIIFYRSGATDYSVDAAWYMISLQRMYKNAAISVTNASYSSATKKTTVYFNVSLNVTTVYTDEIVNLEYFNDSGLWKPILFNGSTNYFLKGGTLFNFNIMEPNDLQFVQDKVVRIRIRSGNHNENGVALEASDWTYLSVTIPTISNA